MLFTYFLVPHELRHRVLFWGIIGAVIMRATFILAGVTIINSVHWMIYLFGAFLIFSDIRIGVKKGEEVHPEGNPVFKFFSRHFPVTSGYRGGHFVVTEKGGASLRHCSWCCSP